MAGSISLITPSYSGDFASCQLLCASIDRFVTGHDMHYIVVGDEDAALFASLAGPRRRIVPHSALLPRFWSVGRWRRRRYWWTPGLGLPVYGWHLQQLRKLAMTMAQASERVMCIDSDNCFCRPFDVSTIAEGTKVPLFVAPGDVGPERPRHVLWLENAHALLGLAAPKLPADDFIGQMIVWERQTVAEITAKIESRARRPWWSTVVKLRQFSEYLIYGAAVTNDPTLAARHERETQSRCLTYWSGAALDAEGLARFISQLEPGQSAIAIQSHTGTPIDLIRRVALDEFQREAL
ncbi:DUF6492 family protein [Devosia sp.]|uniref:DUF6492 family protein n=1 Tax=Devosia sp. TaxID=1871048 RepID=UPI001AD496FC|nr:DUF6492 family protein [Devosia sp.]MBN9333988.1 hypothetical protein [Devosia sp.]